jgi:Protein of unknown function (DUF1402)
MYSRRGLESTLRAIIGGALGRWRQWRLRPVATGLSPVQPRYRPSLEIQRAETLALVSQHATEICAAARRNGVAPEAVAGAIVWEGVENPYRRHVARLGPGKVRPIQACGTTEARRVEAEGRIAPASGVFHRFLRVHDTSWAIDYVAAIMGRHADVYERVASVTIRDDVGVLCTLYQGGRSGTRAARLARERRQSPSARPAAGNDMGTWVVAHLGFVRSLLVEASGPAPPLVQPSSGSVQASPSSSSNEVGEKGTRPPVG